MDNSYRDRLAGAIGIRMLGRVQHEFIYDEGDQDGSIRGKLNFFGRIEKKFTGRNRNIQVLEDLPDVCNQTDPLIVGIISEAFIGAPDCRDAAGRLSRSLSSGSPTALACK